MSDRVDNDAFYQAQPSRPEGAEVAPERFYASAETPVARPSPLVTLPARPIAFGMLLFLVGWIGIAFQQGLFSQIVAGAPLFEEPAKVGGAIALAALLGFRSNLLRLPLALAFGAGFGILEHYLSYSAEDPVGFAVRVAFHAISTATSMAAWTALEPSADARLRWATTLPATLLHYANNFVALVLGLPAVLLPALEPVAMGWSIAVTLVLAFVMGFIALRPDSFRQGVGDLARRFIPAMRT